MAGVGDLVATLVADTAKWKSGLSSAKNDLASFAKGAAASLAGITAGLLSAGAVKGAMFSALAAAESDIQATNKLNAVFVATSHSAGVTAKEIGELAGELQRVTKFEDDATMGAAALLATFKNVKGENFKDAIRLAQDMAVVFDIDLLAAVKKLGKELKSLPVSEVGDKIAELNSKFSGAAKESKTATEQIGLAVGALNERLGKELVPSVNLFAGVAVPAFYKLEDAIDGAAESAPSLTSAFAEWAAMAILPETIRNLKVVRDLVGDINDAASGAPVEKVFVELGSGKAHGPAAELGAPSAPLFEGPTGKDDAFKRRMEEMRTEIDLFRGDITHAEAEFRRAIADGLSPEQAKEIEDQIRLLDGLRQMKDDEEAAAREAEIKKKTTGGEIKGDVGALAKGSADALSAIYTAMNNGKGGADKAVDAAVENVQQNDEMISLLRDVKDKIGESQFVAGSLA